MNSPRNIAEALAKLSVRDVLAGLVGAAAIGAVWAIHVVDSKWISLAASAPLLALMIWALKAGAQERRAENAANEQLETARREWEAASLARLRQIWAPEVALNHLALYLSDAWCFVHETSPSWTLHARAYTWSAVPIPAELTITLAEAALGENKTPLASTDPRCAWSLEIGKSEERVITWALTETTAAAIRHAHETELHVSFLLSLKVNGHPPTDPNQCRRTIVHHLRVSR